MKKIFLLVLGISISFTNIYSQVGVNTEKPLGLFHLDAKNNTTTTSNVTQTDDVLITNEGDVGIGTINPESKLDVNGNVIISEKMQVQGNTTITNNLIPATIGIGTTNSSAKLQIATSSPNGILRLADTSQRSGHLLTCETTTGNAYWEALRPMGSIEEGDINKDITINQSSSPGVPVTENHNLSLSPGRWLIFAKATTKGNLGGFFMYLYLTRKYKDSQGRDQRQVITRAGEMAGTIIGTPGSGAVVYASPQFVYLYEVANTNLLPSNPDYYTVLSLTMTSSSSNGSTSDDYGGGYFYAIRVDRAN